MPECLKLLVKSFLVGDTKIIIFLRRGEGYGGEILASAYKNKCPVKWDSGVTDPNTGKMLKNCYTCGDNVIAAIVGIAEHIGQTQDAVVEAYSKACDEVVC